jgi:hypothetical protein
MRKIEQAMVKAIKGKKDWSKDNTFVVYYPAIETTLRARIEHTKVFLYGNHIATVNHERGDEITANILTLSRWDTPTTKSRLRALGINVYTRRGITYLNEKPITDH